MIFVVTRKAVGDFVSFRLFVRRLNSGARQRNMAHRQLTVLKIHVQKINKMRKKDRAIGLKQNAVCKFVHGERPRVNSSPISDLWP